MMLSGNSKDRKESDLDRWRSRYHQRGLFALVLLSCLVSAGGIWYAVYHGVPSDGQLGGALAVALAFFCMFVARPTAAHILDGKRNGVALVDLPMEKQIPALRNALAVTIDVQRVERYYLAVASIQGTLVWAFGDKIAEALGAQALPC